MAIEHIILGLLRKPLSGYDLKQHFDTVISHFWSAEQSQIYRTLKKLHEDGLVRCKTEPPTKGPERKVYSLTVEGRKELHKWLQNEPEVGDLRLGYVGQLCFMGDLGDSQQSIAFLQQVKKRNERQLAVLKDIQRMWKEEDARYPDELPWDDFHNSLSFDMGMTMAQARIRWCAKAIEKIETRIQSETKGGGA